MTLDRTVSGLVHEAALGRDQNRAHHRQTTERRCEHVRHDIPVVVLACPQHAALGFHDARHCIVDEGVEKIDSPCIKLFGPVGGVFLFEYLLEAGVVGFGNSVFGGEPDILFLVQAEGKASFGI